MMNHFCRQGAAQNRANALANQPKQAGRDIAQYLANQINAPGTIFGVGGLVNVNHEWTIVPLTSTVTVTPDPSKFQPITKWPQ